MAAKESIEVEVAYAKPHRQKIIRLEVEPGCSAYEAVRRSGIVEAFPEIDLDKARMGIFSKRIADPQAHVLKEGDRVEIYRPLSMDPKEIRRVRAEKAKARKL